jgi:hypothetical protein
MAALDILHPVVRKRSRRLFGRRRRAITIDLRGARLLITRRGT